MSSISKFRTPDERNEVAARVLKLHADGLLMREISAETSVSASWCSRICKAQGWPAMPRGQSDYNHVFDANEECQRYRDLKADPNMVECYPRQFISRAGYNKAFPTTKIDTRGIRKLADWKIT